MVLQDLCANITDQGQDKILRQVQLHFFLEFENHICLNESSTFHLCGFPCYLKWTMLYAYKMMNVVLLVDVEGKNSTIHYFIIGLANFSVTIMAHNLSCY